MMSEVYDIAILGAGPAGISAAIYAARAKMNTLWLDKQFAQGGQILNTYEVDNYPGLPGISGMDLADGRTCCEAWNRTSEGECSGCRGCW